MKRIIKLSLLVLTLFSATVVSAGETEVSYPNDYRRWSHVKSMLIEPGHPLAEPFGGLHHVYANDKAWQGLQSGRFSNGSVLVFDLLEYTQADNAIVEGTRKLVGVMSKDQTRYADTGGWGFEGFAGDSKTQRLVSDGGRSCFGCHTSEKNRDYVFSTLRR